MQRSILRDNEYLFLTKVEESCKLIDPDSTLKVRIGFRTLIVDVHTNLRKRIIKKISLLHEKFGVPFIEEGFVRDKKHTISFKITTDEL